MLDATCIGVYKLNRQGLGGILRSSARAACRVAGLIVIVSASSAVSAQIYESREVDKLIASDGARTDYFGQWIAIDGATALIGASGADDRGNDSGSAYVFTRAGGGWRQQQKLLASDGTQGDGFGVAVAVNGGTAIVGAYHDDPSGRFSGSAYVFVRDELGTWAEQGKITPSDGTAFAFFGSSVAVEGDLAMVGSGNGFVYVFARDPNGGWAERQRLRASDALPFDDFGYALTLQGDTAVIGAPRTTEGNPGPGAAYVFTRGASGAWTQRAKLVDPNGHIGDRFGSALSTDGRSVLVGSYGPDADGQWTGAASVFVRDGDDKWTHEARMLPSDSDVATAFGGSVAVAGSTALVGARESGSRGTFSGAVYVFARTKAGGWIERAKLLASDASEFEYFGSSLATTAGSALIGALLGDGQGPATGAVYHFALPRQITIDVKPDDDRNSVNPRSRGLLPVALLGGPGLDVTRIETGSLRFGPRSASPAHAVTDSFAYMELLQDVNNDGYMDLLAHFSIWQAGIACETGAAVLIGTTVDGFAIEGADRLTVSGCARFDRGGEEPGPADRPWGGPVEVRH